MLLSQNYKNSYSSAMTRLAVSCVLSVIGCILLGYFMLPLAAAFYAGILLYEKPNKRILSYVIPIVMFTLNLLLSGPFSLEAISYVLVGAVIYTCTSKKRSKGESVFWTTLLIAALILISAIILPFDLNGSVSYISIKQFYSNLYFNYRTAFVDYITSLKKTSSSGLMFFAFNTFEAEAMFDDLVMSTVPVMIILAFALSGFSLKIFSKIVFKYSGEDSGLDAWDFKTSNTVAYFYVIVSVLTMLNRFNGSVYDYTLSAVDTVFLAVFAYIGIKSFYRFLASRGRSTFFSTVVLVILIVLLFSNALSILSYIGVVVNIIKNKPEKSSETK